MVNMSLSISLPMWLSLCLFLASRVDAGWIDEDTPQDARIITPLPVVPNRPPPKSKSSREDSDSDDDEKASKAKHRGRHRDPTPPPTYFPTVDPTGLPSFSPTTATGAPTSPARIYDLVFSDEFNTPHRTFADGHDPRWTALEKNDYTNDAQHYLLPPRQCLHRHPWQYLVIKSEAEDTQIVGFDEVYKKRQVTKHFKSAMLQSWNKFCFTGGVHGGGDV